MELDYYDYNVANAGAAPGSYLGMDPAFLLWIPPLSVSEDSEDPSADRPDCFQGTATSTSPALFRLPENTEGATLTPAEYRRMRLGTEDTSKLSFGQRRQDSTSSSSSKNDSSSGGSAISEDSIGSESRAARLNERLLPIHRILEDSRTRVSEESLCSQLAVDQARTQCIVPSHGAKSDACQEQDASTRSIHQGSGYVNIRDSGLAKSDDKPEKATRSTSKSHATQRTREISQEDKRYRSKNESASRQFAAGKSTTGSKKTPPRVDGKDKDRDRDVPLIARSDSRSDVLLSNLNVTAAGQCKYRDFTQFTQPREMNKLSDCTNIPMIEFSVPRLSSPAAARRLTTDNLNIGLSRKEIQSPDYGVESDMKAESRDSFYDLIRESEDGIKFADDDDEYIDNRANL